MNNVKQIELDDAEHKEGQARQTKRDGRSKERKLREKHRYTMNQPNIEH